MTRLPHKLALYRAAVQHPAAEVALLRRMYRRSFKREALRLRDDFAGTAALAAEWVAQSEDHRALAVEKHRPTAVWAEREAKRTLGERAVDLPIVCADVMELSSPRVDVVCALNFSAFIYHDRRSLLAYLRHARRCLDGRGLIVLDAFGGPGAMTPGTQERRVDGMTYSWEQRSYDHLTGRIDCRIHFSIGRRTARDAFRYDWRLWTVPELRGLLAEAGCGRVEVWCDTLDASGRQSDGRYRPQQRLPARHDFIAYVCGIAEKA